MAGTTDTLLIVGCHVDDLDSPRPFVVGAIDMGTLDVIGAEEEEQWIKELKGKYETGNSEYVYREVRVKLDTEALRTMFVRGEVTVIGYEEVDKQ